MDKQTHAKSWIVYAGIAFIWIVSLLVIANGVFGADYVITSCQDLQDIQLDAAGNYSLASDIDCSDTLNWNAGAGFSPIENFTGLLNGNGHVIDKLFINRASQQIIGLIAFNPSYAAYLAAVISDIGLTNLNYTCGEYCGGFAGYQGSTLIRCFSTGSITGTFSAYAGGLAGVNIGNISDCWTAVNITGYNKKSGLSAYNGGSISNVYSLSYCYGDGGYGERGGICSIESGGSMYGKSFWNSDLFSATSNQKCASASLGVNEFSMNTSQMQTQSTYSGWDFTGTWQICTRANPQSFPTLRVFGLCCQGDWSCEEYSACGNYQQDCLRVHDGRCGYAYDPALDGNLSSFGKNCTINAQSESVEFLEFDLRYSSNVLLFIGLIMIWLILLGMAFAFSNYILYAAAFMASVFVGVIAAQISWIISIGIIMIMVVIGINYLSKFEN